MSKVIRDAIVAGLTKRTLAFNSQYYPDANPDWTPEQRAIYTFLNGESSGLMRMHESDRPEISKQLAKLAGIEVTSRFSATTPIDVPPFVVITFREGKDDYPSNYPLVKSRISGYWTEQGRGSSKEVLTRIRDIRPATIDDINTIGKKFPDDKLVKLYGAIEFPEKKLRAAIADQIIKLTAEFAKQMVAYYPEGLSDKGRQILDLGVMPSDWIKVFSIMLDDPKMTEDFKPAPSYVEFDPFVAIVHLRDSNASFYKTDEVHVQAGINPNDIFFLNDDTGRIVGNHADNRTANLRVATPDEIKEYVKALPADRLYLYAEALSKEQVTALL